MRPLKNLASWNVYGVRGGHWWCAVLTGESQPRGEKFLGSVAARTDSEAIAKMFARIYPELSPSASTETT